MAMQQRFLAALALTTLAACARPDPMAQNRARCAEAEGAAAARIAACTALVDSGALEPPALADALAHRGDAKRAAGEPTAALRDYDAALSQAEDHAGGLAGRAAILLASGQLDAAEPLVERLIAGGEKLALAQRMRGDIALARGDHAAAIVAYDAALGADARDAHALANRARARERSGDVAGALADYGAAIRIDGALAQARAGRCWLSLAQKRELERARTDAEAAVAADPASLDGQLCRGVLQLRGGEWAGARASFEAALAISPGNPTALFGRGVARRRSGEDAGREDMNQARDFDGRIGERFDEWGVETY